MPVNEVRELGMVMMPWYTMLGLFVVASPVMVLAGMLRGPGLAGVFLLGAVGYFLSYETLHALYHLPDATLNRMGVGRLRAFRAMMAHHTHHHVLRRMAHVNFNVTVPLMDCIFGTKRATARRAELLQRRGQLLGLGLVADLRRGVHAHEVALAGQPHPRRVGHHGRRLGRLAFSVTNALPTFFQEKNGSFGSEGTSFCAGA